MSFKQFTIRARTFVAGGIVVLLALSMFSTSAANISVSSPTTKMKLSYSVYLEGIIIAHYTLDAEAGDNNQLTYSTVGESSWFINFFSAGRYRSGVKQFVVALGDIEQPFRPLQTSSFRSKGHYKGGKPWGLDIDYDEDGNVVWWKTYVDYESVAKKPDFIPLSEADINSAKDMATVTLRFLTHKTVVGDQFCDYKDRVFTGLSVIEFSMRPIGWHDFQRPMRNGFQGEAIVCSMDVRFISGYRKEWLKKEAYDREFYFAKFDDQLPVALLKAKMGTSIGTVYIVLDEMKRENSQRSVANPTVRKAQKTD